MDGLDSEERKANGEEASGEVRAEEEAVEDEAAGWKRTAAVSLYMEGASEYLRTEKAETEFVVANTEEEEEDGVAEEVL